MEQRLNSLAEKIMSLLIFEEHFQSILSEIPEASPYHLADELKTLIVKDYIRPCRDIDNNSVSGILYDSDKLGSYSFALTARGLAYLEFYIQYPQV